MKMALGIIGLVVTIAVVIAVAGVAYKIGVGTAEGGRKALETLVERYKKSSSLNTTEADRLSRLTDSLRKEISLLEERLRHCEVNSERFEMKTGESRELADGRLHIGLNTVYPSRVIINHENEERTLRAGDRIDGIRAYGKSCTLILLSINAQNLPASALFKFACP